MQTTNQPLQMAAFLAEALPYVDSWTPTDINSGGCGVFAQLLSDELTKHGIAHKIFALFLSDCEEQKEYISNMKKFLDTGVIPDKRHTGAEHICILVEDSLYVDSSGIINNMVMHCIEKMEMSYEQLSLLVAEKGEWNAVFDRECIPFIREHLQEIFQHMDDFHTGVLKFPGRTDVHLTDATVKAKMRNDPFASLMSSII